MKLYREKTTAGTGGGCEQAQGHQLLAHHLTSSWWSPQYSVERESIYKQKTTAGTGSGCEQTQVHELWAHMLTIKLFDSSKLNWMKK
jgi:hypothetical protein